MSRTEPVRLGRVLLDELDTYEPRITVGRPVENKSISKVLILTIGERPTNARRFLIVTWIWTLQG